MMPVDILEHWNGKLECWNAPVYDVMLEPPAFLQSRGASDGLRAEVPIPGRGFML